MRRRLIAVLAAGLLLAACSSKSGSDPASESSAAPAQDVSEITVLAAASLTEAFGEIGDAFEAVNPGTTVTFSFGPSDGLAQQIDEGAPADIFASASPAWMDDIEDNGPGAVGRTDFATNRLTVIVPADDPAGITSLDDLAEPGVKLVLAAEGVPAGDYARQILATAGIEKAALDNVVSNEEDVKAVVQKVALGEADAGIVYVTDVTTAVASDVEQITVPDGDNVIATYPIAVVKGKGAPASASAQAFVDYVLGPGQAILEARGFGPAPS
jgi:molybdate transport system substrate-binding protein